MRLVHCCLSRKVMASLNELLKSAAQTLRQIARFAPKFLLQQLEIVALQNGHGLAVLNLQRSQGQAQKTVRLLLQNVAIVI